MNAGRPSWTAEGVASVRAIETLLRPPGQRLFDDAIARHMVRGRFRLMLRSKLLARAADWCQQSLYGGVVNEVLARARFAHETLVRLAAGGLRQAVILGAGFDATAWLPDLPADLTVYEVDRPETQRLKRARLAEARITEPSRVVYVPALLSRDDLPESLRRAGFDSARPAMVTALGLLMYLPRPSVDALFAEIGDSLPEGSEVLYDYFSRYMLDPARSPAGVRRGARRLAGKGEPLVFAADPWEMAALARRSGLRQVESLDGEALTRRYFAARGDPRTIEKGVNLSRAVTDPSLSG